MKIEVPMSEEWANCNHQWRELVSSQFSNEHRVEVRCELCECPGDKDIKTGEVTWPTT